MMRESFINMARSIRHLAWVSIETMEERTVLSAVQTVISLLVSNFRDYGLTLREATLVITGALPSASLSAGEQGRVVDSTDPNANSDIIPFTTLAPVLQILKICNLDDNAIMTSAKTSTTLTIVPAW